MNLYVVENSNYLRERLVRLVSRRSNVQVVGYAATARDAVEEIRMLKPDVVLLDIRLDQGSGLDVLKQIKARKDKPAHTTARTISAPSHAVGEGNLDRTTRKTTGWGDEKYSQPPVVIVLTNYAYPQYRERFLASGADYFFDKSTELDLMLQALDLLRYRFQRPVQRNDGPPPRGRAHSV